MNDRIKLAEAMEVGIKRSSDGRIIERESNPDFDPFTDANDDYSVLCWMRGQVWQSEPDGEPGWPHLNELKGDLQINYKIGDYARAALKVIE